MATHSVGNGIGIEERERVVGATIFLGRHNAAASSIGIAIGNKIEIGLQLAGNLRRSIRSHRDGLAPCAHHISHSHRRAPLGLYVIISFVFATRNRGMPLTRADVFNQFLRHRHLELGVLAKRHANGVAHALGKQRAYAHSTFYAAVLAVASLSDAQVQRKVHIFGIHSHNQSPNRFHHHHRVRSLD